MDPITTIIGALSIIDAVAGLFEKYSPAGIAQTISAKAEAAGRDVTEDELNVIKALQAVAENQGHQRNAVSDAPAKGASDQ